MWSVTILRWRRTAEDVTNEKIGLHDPTHTPAACPISSSLAYPTSPGPRRCAATPSPSTPRAETSLRASPPTPADFRVLGHEFPEGRRSKGEEGAHRGDD